jgi:hypothetical protein
MLLENTHPQLMSKSRHHYLATRHLDWDLIFISDDNGDLGVTLSEHASVVDVGASHDDGFVVDDHQF